MAGGSSFADALTGGIQDISALLPLLGTEQCEEQVGSALSNGYLYAAVVPISIFGSLGVAKAGLKASVAGISVPPYRLLGSRILRNAGFGPSGSNLSLVMLDDNSKDRHLAETHLTSMLERLHIDRVDKLSVKTRRWQWNLTLLLVTAVACIISMAPYIHLNIHGGGGNDTLTKWLFPSTKAFVGFLTTTSIQFVIQRRLLVVIKKRLAFMALDPHVRRLQINEPKLLWSPDISSEKCLNALKTYNSEPSGDTDGESINETASWPDSTATEKPDLPVPPLEELKAKLELMNELFPTPQIIWPFVVLCLIGSAAIIVGYVGCFSIVQKTTNPVGPVIWLGVEFALSFLRILIWALNPKSDDPPPIAFTLELNAHAPLPTCNKFSEELERDKVLPLVRDRKFLKDVTSCAGLLKRFDDTSISLFYTLTRSQVTGKRVLYVTLFDYKDRTTRIYQHRDDPGIRLIAAGSIDINQETRVEETKMGEDVSPEEDNIGQNDRLMSDVEAHCRSAINRLRFGARVQDAVIKTTWALEVKDEDPPALDDEPQRDDLYYLRYNQLEWARHTQFQNRGASIVDHMARLREDLNLVECKEEWEVMALMLLWEWASIEWILAEEMRVCEVQLLVCHSMMRERIFHARRSDPSTRDLVTLTKEGWVANTRVQLTKHKAATLARLGEDNGQFSRFEGWSDMLVEQWKGMVVKLEEKWDFIDQLTNEQVTPTPPPFPDIAQVLLALTEAARERCGQKKRDMEGRLSTELTNVDERLKLGLDAIREFRSFIFEPLDFQWLLIGPDDIEEYGIEAISRGVENSDTIFIQFHFFETDDALSEALSITRSMTALTTIVFSYCFIGKKASSALQATVQSRCSVISIYEMFTQYEDQLEVLSRTIERALDSNRELERDAVSTGRTVVAFSDYYTSPQSFGHIFNFHRDLTAPVPSITIWFLGPREGDLVLTIRHRAKAWNMFLGVTATPDSFIWPVPLSTSFVTEKIPLYSTRHFLPGLGNYLKIDILHSSELHFIQHVELLDSNGVPYQMPRYKDMCRKQWELGGTP